MTTISTTTGVEVDETIYSSKEAALGMRDKANGACVVGHLDRHYDAVNV